MVTGFLGGFTGGLAGGAVVSIVIRAVDDFSKPMKNAEKSVVRLEKATKGLKIAGAGLAIGFGAAIKQSIEFESAFTGVRKTVDLTEAGFEELENRFRTLATEIPISFVELSKIGELAGQLGVTGVDNLEKFTRTIADISRTTNLTAEAAATDFARIANIVQEPIENIDRMGSVTVELGNNLATTEAEITEFALRIAAAGKISGMTTSDILAIGASFSSVGVQAERGGTAVNKVLIEMTEAIAAGGEKLELFSRTAGLTTMEFKELFERDAAGAFEAFVLGLGKAGDEAFEILEGLGLADQRLIQSFLALAGAGDLISDAFDMANKEWDTNLALTEEAEKRYKTLESQLTLFTNKLKDLGKEIGDELAPKLGPMLLDPLGDLIEIFKELPQPIKDLTIELGILTVAMAGVALVSAKAALIIGAIVGTILLVDKTLSVTLGTNLPGIMIGAMTTIATGILFIINTGVDAIEKLINSAISGLNKLISVYNVLADLFGFDEIGEIAPMKFDRAKYPKISFGPVPFADLIPYTGKHLFTPEMPRAIVETGQYEYGTPQQAQYISIDINQIIGMDPEEVSRSLKEELSSKYSI